MGNDPAGNFLKCVNPVTGEALKDVSLDSNGGAGGNGGGLTLSPDGKLIAAVLEVQDVVPRVSRGRRMHGWVRAGPSAFGDEALRRKLIDAALALGPYSASKVAGGLF